MRPERDEYLDDVERGRFSPRRVLASGWFRAFVVLAALAIVLIVSVPYVLRWLDGSQPVARQQARPVAPPAAAPPPSAPAAPATPPARAAAPQPATPPQARIDAPRVAPSGEKPAMAQPRRDEPAPAAERRKPMAAAVEESRSTTAGKARGGEAASAGTRAAPRPGTSGAGSYWVQVGVFQNAANARRLAESLRQEGLPVQVAEVTRAAAAPSRHEVVVSGASVETVTRALGGSGTAQRSGDLVTVRPTLDLRDAVALSRRLASEGLTVRIRRAAGAAGTTHHVVRVGGYPSRAAAVTARKSVEARGLAAFVTQGAAR